MRLPFLAPLCLACLTLAACGGKTDSKVAASTQDAYDDWFSRTTDAMSPDDARVLRESQQEIKLDIMAHGSATGSAGVKEAFLAKVDGLTARQMMELGLKDRLARLTAEHDDSKRLLDQNSQLKVREGDDTANAALTSRLEEERQRVARAESEMASTKADLERIERP